MGFNQKTFLTRSLSSLVYLIVLLGGIFVNYYSFSLLFLLISLGCLIEFYRLNALRESRLISFFGIFMGFLMYSLIFFYTLRSINFSNSSGSDFISSLFDFTAILLILILFIIPSIDLFSKEGLGFKSITITVYGLVYCIVPFICMHLLALNFYSENTYSPYKVLSIFLLIWSNDTFAYLFGSWIGKNKLMERVSPGKTWEGTIAGIVFTVALGVILSFLLEEYTLQDGVFMAMLIAIGGTIGDLIESKLKRQAGVKDSGNIMPGHGGFLDRFDSFLFAIPLVTIYFIFTSIFN